MKIIVGLGNPTDEYTGTRHNIGFSALDYIADRAGIKVHDKKFKALCGSGVIAGQKVILVKPQTYMNLSGEAVIEVVNYYKCSVDDVLIIYDDICLEPGFIRIREKGSAGGHNGIKNIIKHLGTENFSRIRIGVGEKPKDWDLADYVLGHFSTEETKIIRNTFDEVFEAVELYLQGNLQAAMNLFNKKKL